MRRRDFLSASLAVIAAGVAPHAFARQPTHGWLGAHVDADGQAHAVRVDADGGLRFQHALPARSHGAAFSAARGEIIVVSRRPGDYLLVLDAASGALRQHVAAAPQRYFNGHAVFARGLLFATETLVADEPPEIGNGLIGVYDPARGYARVGEFPSGGHDPHQLLTLGDTLAVCNGGLLTHVDAPGVVLNPDAMNSSLALIDARDGRIDALHRLSHDLRRLGLRHMAARSDGTIAVGMQYEGARSDDVPLVAVLRPGQALRPLELDLQSRLKNYVGSVDFDASGTILALTSPRGGVALLHDLDADKPVALFDVADGCALGADGTGRFVVGSGLGGMRRVSGGATSRMTLDPAIDTARWDNHLLDLPA